MQIKRYILGIGILTIFILTGAGCLDVSSGSDSTEKAQIEQQQSLYVNNQPVPTFDWSLERHIFTELYKARNNAVQTYSYVRNLNGQVIFACKSIGFPMPANTQLTNPEKRIGDGYDGEIDTIPQAEPNGLYTSSSTVGTYIFCLNSDGTVSPSYFEAEVESHLSPLASDERSLSGESNLKIQVQE